MSYLLSYSMAVFETERWRVTTNHYIQSGTWFNIEFYRLVGWSTQHNGGTNNHEAMIYFGGTTINLSTSPTTALHDMCLPLHITSGQQQNQMMVSWVKQTSQQPTSNYWGLPPQQGGHLQQNATYYHSFSFNKPATTGSKRAVITDSLQCDGECNRWKHQHHCDDHWQEQMVVNSRGGVKI